MFSLIYVLIEPLQLFFLSNYKKLKILAYLNMICSYYIVRTVLLQAKAFNSV